MINECQKRLFLIKGTFPGTSELALQNTDQVFGPSLNTLNLLICLEVPLFPPADFSAGPSPPW